MSVTAEPPGESVGLLASESRPTAAVAQARSPQDAQAALRDSLRSSTDEERRRAARAAGQLGADGKPVGVELVRLLKDPVPSVRQAAFEALDRIGVEPAWFVPVIWEVLQDDHGDVVDARRTLQRKGFDPSAVAKILGEALSGADRTVRRDAALMLLRLESAAWTAKAALERVAANDEDAVVREYAQEALERLTEESP